MSEEIRWKQRLSNYSKALKQLTEAVNLSRARKLSALEEQGMIQAFEYTHELAWKTLKDFLEVRGNKDLFGSKDAVRQAFQFGLLAQGEVWMDMIRNRNETSHTYDEETKNRIVQAIVGHYHSEFLMLEKKLAEFAA